MTQPQLPPSEPNQYGPGDGVAAPLAAAAAHGQLMPAKQEFSVGRALFWGAVWGGVGALASIVCALLVIYLLVMILIAGISNEVSFGDIFTGLDHVSGAVPPGVLLAILGACAVSSCVSMVAVLVLRRSRAVRCWRPGFQGLAGAGSAYAFVTVVGPTLFQFVAVFFN